jgi:hypothetical protein
VAIFTHLATREGLTVSPEVPARLREILREIPRGPSFGNGRLIRNLLDEALATQSERLTPTSTATDLATLLPTDLTPPTEPQKPTTTGLYL